MSSIDRGSSHGAWRASSIHGLRWLSLLLAGAYLSCSEPKTETGPPGTTPDATFPTPDAPSVTDIGTTPTEASGADVSTESAIDASVDVADDRMVDPSSDAADARDTGPSSDAADAFVSDSELDAPDATDANPCSTAGAYENIPRTSQPRPSDQVLNCTPSKPCPEGLLCVGIGCDDIWECMVHAEAPAHHPCPTDFAPYCGCDGVTFMSLNTCPDRPYDRPGACEDGVNCDPNKLRCTGPEPPCPEGEVRSVVDGRYYRCVPFDQCRCEFVWECPHREKYRCDAIAKRCGPVPVDP